MDALSASALHGKLSKSPVSFLYAVRRSRASIESIPNISHMKSNGTVHSAFLSAVEIETAQRSSAKHNVNNL